MKILSKKITKSILFVFFVFFLFVIKINAGNLPVRVDPEDNPTNFVNKTTYTLLAPFGDSLKTIDTTNIADYFNLMIKIFIGLCAVLAVVMIVVYGIQYMGTDSIFSKSKAKERIGEAILGLLIALGSYAILNTINPDLTEIRLNIGKVNIEIGGETNEPVSFVGANKVDPSSVGILCNKTGGFSNINNVTKSFSGKMTYLMGGKGQAGPSGNSGATIYYDCSGFVNAVYMCSGINNNSINGGTANIFSGSKAEKVNNITQTSINGVELKAGDLVGWPPSGGKYGHVLIYLGNGIIADSHGGKGKEPGMAYGEYSLSNYKYKDSIKYVVRGSLN